MLVGKVPEPSSAAVLPEQSARLNQLVGDAANAAENIDRKMKATTSPIDLARRGGAEVTELLRIISALNKVSAEQQKTIHDLVSKPAKGNGLMEQTVTIVGLGSTLLTMLLSWRKDRRELEELRAKLATSGVATTEKPS